MRLLCLTSVLAATAASAGTVQIEAFTNNSGNSSLIDSRATMSADSIANTFTIVLSNHSTAGSIASFYIEGGSSILNALSGTPTLSYSHTGMSFAVNGGTQPDDANGITDWGSTWLKLGATPPPPQNGINPNESMTVVFSHDGTFSLAAFMSALATGEIRMAQHYISWTGGESEWLVTTTAIVPLPPAAYAGLGTLAVALGVRKLRRR